MGKTSTTPRLQASDAWSITPHDTNKIVDGNGNQATPCLIYVGTEGDVEVVTALGTTVVFKNYQGWLPVYVEIVKATLTTATDIVGAL